MFDWLIPILIVMALLIWILDYLGMLEVIGALLELIGAAVAAILRLATWLVRKIAPSRDVSLDQPRLQSPESPRPEYKARWRGSRRPRTD